MHTREHPQIFNPKQGPAIIYASNKPWRFTVVDLEFYYILSQWKWSVDKLGYFRASGGKVLHELIFYLSMKIKREDEDIDHINEYRFVNLSSNLKAISHQENIQKGFLNKGKKFKFSSRWEKSMFTNH